MRAATKHAYEAIRRVVDTVTAADADSVRRLFDVAEVLHGSATLSGVLADRAADQDAKRGLINRVFGARIGAAATKVLEVAGAERWEDPQQFVHAVQDAAVRAAAETAGAHDEIGRELDFVLETLAANPDLELSLSSRLNEPAAKASLAEQVFAPRVRAETLDILKSLLLVPGKHRIRRALIDARASVADQAGRSVATVTVARALPQPQVERLRSALSKRFGREVTIHQVIDESVLGGMRVAFGDDVIDDTAAARLNNLRLQLA